MHNRIIRRAIISIAASTLLAGMQIAAQTRPAPPAKAAEPAPAAAPAAPALTDRDVANTQTELIKLLRLSPTLTTVVARDPSLLSNQDYVAKNNPQLAEFLASHPEVARNPDYYLFTHMNRDGGAPDEALERAVWPDVYRMQGQRTGFDELVSNLPPVFALVAFLLAAGWALRLFVENRRWSRIFTLQNEVHAKLIDKFSSNQELAAYMETDAGKRFLEAAPIPVNLGADRRVPNAVARVLTPIQIGVVLVLLGVGFLMLCRVSNDHDAQIMRVLGTLILMPGLGFIISAGITWVLATRLGLMPPRLEAPHGAPPANRLGTPFGSTDRQ
jgi:hypothetical protein